MTTSTVPGQFGGPVGGLFGVPGAGPGRPVTAPDALPPPVVRTRWRKTPTTFGPVGRLLSTLGLVLPFLFLVVTGVIGDPFTLGGAVIWGVILMPWGLRDVWRAGTLPAR